MGLYWIYQLNKWNSKIYIWVIVVTTITIWAVILLIFGIKLEGSVLALKKLPLVVTVEAVLWLVFTQWAWKLKMFQSWLVTEPIIEGTWKGKLFTTWNSTVSSESTPIPVVLSIKQSFNNISCSMYTQESSSISYTSKIYIDTDSGTKIFTYSYRNKPKASVRHRSEFHDGTINLRIVSNEEMEGDYWTTRKTTGDIEVKFHSKNLSYSFN